MERIYLEFLIKVLVGVPIIILILKFLFKESIVMRVGILIFVMIFIMESVFELQFLSNNLSFPILLISFSLILYKINKMLKKPLMNINEIIRGTINSA